MTTDKNKVSEPIKRFDPIHWSDMGGWSYDSASIKEAKDGDFVRFEDHEEVVARLRAERDELVGALESCPNPHGGEYHNNRILSMAVTELRLDALRKRKEPRSPVPGIGRDRSAGNERSGGNQGR